MECPLCHRDTFLTEHHLVPKCRWRRRSVRWRFRGSSYKRSVYICEDCHRHIHQKITPTLLANQYFTVERLLEHPQIASFTEWVSKRSPDKRVTVRALKKH